MENLYEGKAKINITTGFCEIVLPAKRPVFVILFLGIWLLIWPIGIISASTNMLSGSIPQEAGGFISLWLIFAIGISLFALRKMIWMMFGKEIITIERNELKIERKKLIPFKSKSYDLGQINNINTQVYDEDDWWGGNSRRNFWRAYTKGTILFDYGMKTVQFGESIHEGEARTIINLLVQKGIIKQEQVFNGITQNKMGHNWRPE